MTDEARWPRGKAFFQDAIERPPSERGAFLAAVEGDDEALPAAEAVTIGAAALASVHRRQPGGGARHGGRRPVRRDGLLHQGGTRPVRGPGRTGSVSTPNASRRCAACSDGNRIAPWPDVPQVNRIAPDARPLFERIGTSHERKRHVVFDAGHMMFPRGPMTQEILGWLNLHLGPVER